ncbi:MAG TPA: competence/damage-inducible protein A [Candidatus Wunengus sp. YC63]|uniref:competence/damage-inducible protein A n=1 Tax=Candidatus Wunengus sp. YC63 TaxID=3367699 RepID=UPI004024CAA9
MITAEIITIGTEIVSGQIMDTNAPHIAQNLLKRGIQVLFQTSVGDDKELLKSVLKIARGRANLIITTGGLGPTGNDITREAVSEFFDVFLVSDEEAHTRIRTFLESRHAKVKNGHQKQALIPAGAFAIHNDQGTAAGFVFQGDGIEIVCLPGVPGEMQTMLNKYLETYAIQHKAEELCTLTRNIHTFGVSEPDIDAQLKEYAGREGQIKAMTLVHDGIVTINILATATREDAIKILDRTEQDIREKLGHAVFGVGDEMLESAVATILKKYNKTIAVAESCTGGLVSDKLTNIPGISEYFLEGVVAYSNKAKVDILGVSDELIQKHGAVSQQVAKAMAEGVKKRSSANIGVGITGIAGPTGATKEKPVGLVYIAVIVDDITEVKECRFRGSRIDIKNFSANTALNMGRLKLIDIC